MNGLELSESFFKECAEPVFSQKFPELFDGFLCFGLAGPGSECYGFDDGFSQDHDFSPDFCVFYPESEGFDRKLIFALERTYAKLPKEYRGYKRTAITHYAGAARRGVIGVNEFYSRYIPGGAVPEDVYEWLRIPDENLCEATNGKIFRDPSGLFGGIKNELLSPPPDVVAKKLAGRLFSASQNGSYNYLRMMKRGEKASAALFLSEFVIDAASCAYLLDKKPKPYRKWLLKGLDRLSACSGIRILLEELLSGDGSASRNAELISNVETLLVSECAKKYGPDGIAGQSIQTAAFAVNGHISNNNLRSEEIMFAI